MAESSHGHRSRRSNEWSHILLAHSGVRESQAVVPRVRESVWELPLVFRAVDNHNLPRDFELRHGYPKAQETQQVHAIVCQPQWEPAKHLLRKLQNLAKRMPAKFHTELHKLCKASASRRYLSGVLSRRSCSNWGVSQ